MRPLVGISAYSDRARWDIWDAPAALVPDSYVAALDDAGAIPVALPPTADVAEAIDRLDGLVLTAGPDVDPSCYGAALHPQSELRPGRDEPELALLAAARAADLPVLGVCRGMQLMAISWGGSLFQHLPDVLGTEMHCRKTGTIERHGVDFVPGHHVAAVLGRQREVTSHHHQGVRDPGELTVTARSSDGLVEAVEDPELTFRVGVQWHPELEHPELFGALVSACAAQASGIEGVGRFV